jgi:hypothetical protein
MTTTLADGGHPYDDYLRLTLSSTATAVAGLDPVFSERGSRMDSASSGAPHDRRIRPPKSDAPDRSSPASNALP